MKMPDLNPTREDILSIDDMGWPAWNEPLALAAEGSKAQPTLYAQLPEYDDSINWNTPPPPPSPNRLRRFLGFIVMVGAEIIEHDSAPRARSLTLRERAEDGAKQLRGNEIPAAYRLRVGEAAKGQLGTLRERMSEGHQKITAGEARTALEKAQATVQAAYEQPGHGGMRRKKPSKYEQSYGALSQGDQEKRREAKKVLDTLGVYGSGRIATLLQSTANPNAALLDFAPEIIQWIEDNPTSRELARALILVLPPEARSAAYLAANLRAEVQQKPNLQTMANAQQAQLAAAGFVSAQPAIAPITHKIEPDLQAIVPKRPATMRRTRVEAIPTNEGSAPPGRRADQIVADPNNAIISITDSEIERATLIAQAYDRASISLLQGIIGVDYLHASALIDELKRRGITSEA